jgi:hypothetical protein
MIKEFTLQEKIAAISLELAEIQAEARRNPGSSLHRQYETLKAIAADLRARQDLPRNNALGALGREIARVKASKTGLGYSEGRMIELGNIVISKWPVISQALEQFGEESAE